MADLKGLTMVQAQRPLEDWSPDGNLQSSRGTQLLAIAIRCQVNPIEDL